MLRPPEDGTHLFEAHLLLSRGEAEMLRRTFEHLISMSDPDTSVLGPNDRRNPSPEAKV